MGGVVDALRAAKVRLGLVEATQKRGRTLGDVARHPVSGGLLNVIAVIAGIFGSVVAADVQAFVSSVWAGTPNVPPYNAGNVAWFGGASFLLVIFFAFRQWAIDRQRLRDHVSMRRIGERIQSTVRTHPPHEFMQELGVAVEKAFVIARDAATQVERELAIRLILQQVAEVAETFEGSSEIHAGANLMIFLRREDPTTEQWTNWYRRIKFFDGDPARLDGMLVLSPRLAATAQPLSGQSASDPSVVGDARIGSLALPVPHDTGGPSLKRKWNVLPGAPLAYVRKDFEWFSPVSELHTWSAANCDLRDEVRQGIREYFDGKSFESFMSVPVFSPSAQYELSDRREVCAVINVHWDKGNRLTVVEAASNFARAIYPLCVFVSELLKESSIPNPEPADTAPPGA